LIDAMSEEAIGGAGLYSGLTLLRPDVTGITTKGCVEACCAASDVACDCETVVHKHGILLSSFGLRR
jgi:hypothetical protein